MENQFVVNEAGTKWVRTKKKKQTRKADDAPEPAELLLPMLKGEAAGDYQLAVIMTVRRLLQDPMRYTSKHRALNSLNQPAPTTSITARKWNIHGAVEHVTFPYASPNQRREIFSLISRCLPAKWKGEPLFRYLEDDSTTHGMVMYLLGMAISARKNELAKRPN